MFLYELKKKYIHELERERQKILKPFPRLNCSAEHSLGNLELLKLTIDC